MVVDRKKLERAIEIVEAFKSSAVLRIDGAFFSIYVHRPKPEDQTTLLKFTDKIKRQKNYDSIDGVAEVDGISIKLFNIAECKIIYKKVMKPKLVPAPDGEMEEITEVDHYECEEAS